jgi:hypothetical protein
MCGNSNLSRLRSSETSLSCLEFVVEAASHVIDNRLVQVARIPFCPTVALVYFYPLRYEPQLVWFLTKRPNFKLN